MALIIVNSKLVNDNLLKGIKISQALVNSKLVNDNLLEGIKVSQAIVNSKLVNDNLLEGIKIWVNFVSDVDEVNNSHLLPSTLTSLLLLLAEILKLNFLS